jgi:hypothetical protein
VPNLFSNLLALPGRARLGNNVVFIFVLPHPRPPLPSNFEGFYEVLEQLYPCSVFGPNVFV